MKFYVDTSIWRDYYEDREDKLKPLGEFAFQMFRAIKSRGDLIIVSDFMRHELRTHYSENEIKDILNPFKEAILPISITKEQHKEAQKLAFERDIPKGDALHAIIARDNNAILITRDVHFERLRDIAEIKTPEAIT